MNENQTFTSLDKAIAQTEKTIDNLKIHINVYGRLCARGFGEDQTYADLLKEQILQLTILDALQAKKRALKKEVLESYRNNEKWNWYIKSIQDSIEDDIWGYYVQASGMKVQP
jgi:phosphosulfolactate phosphohydrolase-like enzyme